MQITTLPVYSKLADPTSIPEKLAQSIPAGWHLSQHQVETYKALISPDVDVVINTAMTGDGKSLAAYLPTLVLPNHHAFGMYPTIELKLSGLSILVDSVKEEIVQKLQSHFHSSVKVKWV